MAASRQRRSERILCFEALRLASLLAEHPQAARPKTFALLALFCFNAARLSGRVDAEGLLVPLESQDRSKWDYPLIAQGLRFLAESAREREVSEFHLEAALASLHSNAPSYAETDWPRIHDLYMQLERLKPTPVVALNRAIAAGMAYGAARGSKDLEALQGVAALAAYPFYPAAQGEFRRLAGELEQARACFLRAAALARNPAEQRFFERKLAQVEQLVQRKDDSEAPH
ncbi:MAG: hypothetical protein QM756_40340 [Polyangiaceae bacterium]